jgi:hypothetical protein
MRLLEADESTLSSSPKEGGFFSLRSRSRGRDEESFGVQVDLESLHVRSSVTELEVASEDKGGGLGCSCLELLELFL